MSEGRHQAFLQRTLASAVAGLVVDVGAASGDFTAALLARHGGLHWLMVEPDPDACAGLRARFAGRPNVVVEELALGAAAGRAVLHRHADGTQNSLLARVAGTAAPLPVVVDTLDALLARHPRLPPPILVKTDAQGGDLEVLRGAQATLRQHRPLVQAEVITVTLYHGQCTAAAIMGLMAASGYDLADIVMPHHRGEDLRLAFCDMVFAPAAGSTSPDGPFVCLDAAALLDQVGTFARAAEERLRLVEHLHGECAARLRIITDQQQRLAQAGLA